MLRSNETGVDKICCMQYNGISYALNRTRRGIQLEKPNDLIHRQYIRMSCYYYHSSCKSCAGIIYIYIFI